MPTELNPLMNQCEDVASTLKTLAHPQRLSLLCHLSNKAYSVGELQELCNISQSYVSQFLLKMTSQGLIERKRNGTHVYYSIKDPKIHSILESLQKIYCNKT